MAVEQGWYHYPGDPDGTVRLWNGSQWVGYPTQPPPGHDGHPIATTSAGAASSRSVAKPFKNQVRLAPFAVLALLGLVATTIFVVRSLMALRSEVTGLAGRDRRFLDRDTVLTAPFSADVYRQLFLVGVIGGLLFLMWVWRANANIGVKVRPKRNSGNQFAWKWLLFGWNFLLFEAVFRTVFGPVITRMSNCVERSTPGGSGGIGLTLMHFLWWLLWGLSGLTFLVSAVALSDRGFTTTARAIETWGTVQSLALVAHMASLVLAMGLVVSITMQQDRRLG